MTHSWERGRLACVLSPRRTVERPRQSPPAPRYRGAGGLHRDSPLSGGRGAPGQAPTPAPPASRSLRYSRVSPSRERSCMRHSRERLRVARPGLLRLIIALSLLLIPVLQTPAVAQVTGPAVEHTTLPTGLTLVTEQRPESRAAGLALVI